MEKANNRLALITLVASLLVVYVFIFSGSGILERIELGKQKSRLGGRIAALREDNARLRQMLLRYGNGEFMPEEAQKAGYVEPGTRVLFVQGNDPESPDRAAAGPSGASNFSQISHLRILWLVVSVLILFFYFARMSRVREDTP